MTVSLTSPALRHYGSSGLVLRQVDTEIDKEGLITGSAVFTAPMNTASAISPQIGQFHPLDARMTIEKVKISYGPGFAVINCTCYGISGDEDETDPTTELSIGTNQEPIEIHPRFTEVAGTPSTAKTVADGGAGAIFVGADGKKSIDDDTAVFKKWSAKSPHKGIESYLDSTNITWRLKYTSRRAPSEDDMRNVGNIDVPADAPPLPGGRTWLYVGMSSQERAHVYSVSKEWRASAKGGWNKTWYTESENQENSFSTGGVQGAITTSNLG